jgi:hypothetical protein
MKKIIYLLFITFSFSSISFAVADEINVRNGNDLYELYKSSKRMNTKGTFELKDAMKASMYSGFVSGTAAVMIINGINHNNPAICIETNTTIEQYADVLGMYLENHPNERHESSLILINKAFPAAFPCKESKRK